MIHQSLYHMPLKLMICSMNCSSVEMTQDDLFPSGWALGQGTDPYGLPFLTVSLAVVTVNYNARAIVNIKKIKSSNSDNSFFVYLSSTGSAWVIGEP